MYEGQRFPVWIESGSVLVLQAVSTKPSKLVSVLHSAHHFLFFEHSHFLFVNNLRCEVSCNLRESYHNCVLKSVCSPGGVYVGDDFRYD